VTEGDAELARARYARVQAAMARRGVGALLLAAPHLGTFASGARRVRVAGGGGSLPWVVVTAGAPAATVFTPDPDGAPRWMPRASVEPLRWDRDAQLRRIVALVASTPGSVACDVLAPALRAALAPLDRPLVDAAALLAEAAAPRSEDELKAIAGALRAARRGLAAAAAAVALRATPAALATRFLATMTAARAGFPLSEGLVWRSGARLMRLAAEDALHAGDVLALEYGLYVAGHAGVAGDTVACDGRDLSASRRAWSEALCVIAGRCRAGATTADLRETAADAGAGQEGLLAHGLGVGIEPPFVDLDGDDAEPLRAGTVLVLAPVVDGFRATRALVVTGGAARWIEAAP
jgi:hypothetical protein